MDHSPPKVEKQFKLYELKKYLKKHWMFIAEPSIVNASTLPFEVQIMCNP